MHRLTVCKILPMILAVFSLLVSGGLFAHADEFGAEAHVHIAQAADDHAHASKDASSGIDGQSIHCGSNILFPAITLALLHPAIGRHNAIPARRQMAGRRAVPEPPPPRSFVVFQS